jgi:hypothetical protein
MAHDQSFLVEIRQTAFLSRLMHNLPFSIGTLSGLASDLGDLGQPQWYSAGLEMSSMLASKGSLRRSLVSRYGGRALRNLIYRY